VTRHEGRFDLHMHTTWSDGTDSVADVVALVAERKLAGFSITDHDTIAAQEEARALALEFGLAYITGIELSVLDGENDLHVLVYGFDPGNDEFLVSLEGFRRARVERALGMARKLTELGCPLDIDAILSASGPGAVGRPHLARALVQAGFAGTVREAFDRYLAAGRPAYLPKMKITPADGIALAHRAGGVAVLAHPAVYPFEVPLPELVACGLDGLETSYPSWDNQTTAHWRALARQYRLLETGGSDFHGSHRPGVPVGAATISREMFERVLTAAGS
jgi:predicted metal-dependent phosphoesterase TrpH